MDLGRLKKHKALGLLVTLTKDVLEVTAAGMALV
jgi:hypothetical protein